jgi:hypothetical protein
MFFLSVSTGSLVSNIFVQRNNKYLSTEIGMRVDPSPFSMKAIACTITPKLFILQMELFPRTWIMMPTLPRYSDHSRRSTLGQGAIRKIKNSKIDWAQGRIPGDPLTAASGRNSWGWWWLSLESKM